MTTAKHKGQAGQTAHKFEAGGELGSIEDRNERDRRREPLPPEEKELAEMCARFADLCRYFADAKIDVPSHVLVEIEGMAKLAIRDRIRILNDANRRLMEYLDDVGEDPKVRQ